MNKAVPVLAIVAVTSLHAYAQNNALNFDGSDDYVNLCSNCSSYGSTTITYEAWVNPSNATGTRVIVVRGNLNSGVSFGLQDNKVWVGGNSGGGWNNSFVGDISNNVWTHIAATYDQASGDISVYVGGNFEQTVNRNFIVNSPDFTTNIGKNQLSLSQYFQGDLDEVRIWNTARTQTEIQDNMNIEVDCSHANLVACYHFNEGIAGGGNTGLSTLEDGTTNGLDGNLLNFALTGNSSNWVSGASVLPIELISFTARLDAGRVLLQWETATEINNEGFQIERSADGVDWVSVGFVPGGGTTSVKQRYSYIDARPFEGVNYYRLKQLDFDGSSDLSQVVSVAVDLKNDFDVFPNPVSEYMYITAETGSKYRLVNSYGETEKVGVTTSERLDMVSLSDGIYFLQIESGNRIITKRVIKH